MASDDFVKQMQDTLRKQQESNDLQIRNKLHNAKVIETEGKTNWDKLSEFVGRKIKEINKNPNGPITFRPDESAFSVFNSLANRGISARHDAASGNIAYDGTASGIFRAQVKGNELAYSLEESVPVVRTRAKQGAGDSYALQEIGEFLIRAAISQE